MSYSFHIKNGDLNLGGPGGLATVTGSQKVVQDLKHWILEQRGTDPMHPEYGSTLDGEMLPDGNFQDSFIGTTIDAFQILNIEAELRRVLAAYQQQQLERLRFETQAYNGKHTFAPGEIVSSIDDVVVQQFGDILVAKISITVSNGQSFVFAQPVS